MQNVITPRWSSNFIEPLANWGNRLLRDFIDALAIVLSSDSKAGKTCSEVNRHNPPVSVPVARRRKRRSSRRRPQSNNVAVPAPTLAASYARYSTNMQSCESTEDQHRINSCEASKNGQTIPSRLEFSDEAISGTKRERPGLNDLLDAASRGEFGTLYIYNLSRLARSLLISISVLRRLVNKHKVRVICPVEGLDSERGDWEFMAVIIAAINERYIAELAQSVFRGLESRLLGGFAVGDHPYGYTTVLAPGESPHSGRGPKPKKIYKIDQAQAMVVCQIYEWFARDKRSISSIVSELNTQAVPRCHRSSTTEWHHAIVVGILENDKYTGVWAWGVTKNVRDHETGQIKKEIRTEDEIDKWTRVLSHLQIVDDETFDAVQERLAANRKTYAKDRKSNGQLHGSPAGRGRAGLLSGTLMCGMCPRGSDYARLVVSGRYYKCPRIQRGTCSCDKWIRKDLAERLVVDVVKAELLGSEKWLAAVYSALRQEWQLKVNRLPSEAETLRQQSRQLEAKIERLLNEIEESDDHDVRRRLKKRQAEHHDVVSRLRRAERDKSSLRDEPPTMKWLQEMAAELTNILGQDNEAAREALRDLVGGRILVEKVAPNDGKPFLRGRFILRGHNLISAVAPGLRVDDAKSDEGCEITIDFVEPEVPSKIDVQAIEAKRLYDLGMLGNQIAVDMKLSKSRVTAVLKHWFTSRGLDMPDGRARRHKLKQSYLTAPLYRRIADRVKLMLETGLLIGDIATELKIDRNTITRAIKFAYESSGLPVPDGRTRRKELDRKSRRANERGGWRDDR